MDPMTFREWMEILKLTIITAATAIGLVRSIRCRLKSKPKRMVEVYFMVPTSRYRRR